jgi:hypothetical protein
MVRPLGQRVRGACRLGIPPALGTDSPPRPPRVLRARPRRRRTMVRGRAKRAGWRWAWGAEGRENPFGVAISVPVVGSQEIRDNQPLHG